MKKYFGKLCVGGVLLLSLSMSLTSCEDILGHWEKPTPNPITPDTGGDSTPAAAPTYLKWNDGTQALEAVEIPDAPSMTSTTTTWSGTYIVSEDVTIDDDVTLGGDVDLIILDGKTLTLTDDHWITASTNNYTLNIYGQSTTTGAGKLVVNTTTSKIRSIYVESGTINIHSGIVSATATKDHSSAVRSKNMNIYGGEVEAKGFSVGLNVTNLSILGGTVTAENGDGADTWAIESSTIIIDGSTTSVTAKGGNAIDKGLEQIPASQGIYATTSMTINDGEVIVTGGDGVTNMGRGAVAIVVPGGSLTVNGGSLTATGGKAVDNRNGGNAFEGSLIIKGGKAKFVGGDGSGTGAGGYGIRYTTSPGIDYYGGSVMALGGAKGDSGTTDGEANSDGTNGDINNSSGSVQTYRSKSIYTSPWADGGSISAGVQSITGTMGIAIPAEW